MVQIEPSPVSGVRRLGYPCLWKLKRAHRQVTRCCPEEAAAYKRARRQYEEARRRWKATRNRDTWSWYVRGDGNSQSVAFRTFMEKKCRHASETFDSLYHKYRAYELLSRREERKRAKQEMLDAVAALDRLRSLVFDRMGVPEVFRRLA
jgi:hypothetical protein